MKGTFFVISRAIGMAGLLVGLLAGAGCDQSTGLAYEEGLHDNTSGSGNASSERVSIAYLKSQARGNSTPLTQSLVIEGRITANDLFGEWDHGLVIQDASGGIEVEIDRTLLYHDYPLGAPLRIYCDGLALGDYGGKIVLGAEPTGEYVVDRIAEVDLGRFLHPLNDSHTPIAPLEITMTACSKALIGTFVRLRGVAFIDEEKGLCWCDFDSERGEWISTTRHLCDEAGNQLALYTPGSCHYATEPLPSGKGSISGILDYFNGAFQLRVVYHDFLFE